MRSFPAVVLSVLVIGSLFGQSYTIQTLAGGGIPPDGPALAANLRSCKVGGLALDPTGQLGISLSQCHIVMLLDRTGKLTRIAGTGTSGFAGDGGPALNAHLSQPIGITFDSSGNLYIADMGNNRVRRVEAATGVITTVAGNGDADYLGGTIKATNAGIYAPHHVAIDHQGQLYISSSSANGIWRVDTKEENISWMVGGRGRYGFAGDGGPAWGASIMAPQGLGVDGSGNLYFVDSGNYRIRKIEIQSGLITTVAGGGLHGSVVDGSAATDEQLGYGIDDLGVAGVGDLYIPTATSIKRVDASSGNIYSVAAISGAFAVKVNTSGDKVYSTESNLVQLTSAGSTAVVAGGGLSIGDGAEATKAMLSAPTSTVVDASGALYIWDTGNGKIRKASRGLISTYAGNGQFFTEGSNGDGGPATAASLHGQQYGGLAFDGEGNLLFAEGSYIRKVAPSSGVITTIAGKPTDPGCGQYAGESGVAALGVCLSGVASLALDAAGNMFFSLLRDNLVVRVSKQTGLLEWYAGNRLRGFTGDGMAATSAMLAVPYGIAVDAHGNLLIADSANDCIRRVDAATGIISVVAGIGEFGAPSGDGSLATQARLHNPTAVAVDIRGNIFIADTGANAVLRVDAITGIITTIAGGNGPGLGGDDGPAIAAQLNGPTGLSLDASRRIYFSDTYNNRIRVLIPSGETCTYTVSPLAPATVPAAGGTLQITIQTGSACAWTVTGMPGWITVSGASSGTGPATATLVAVGNAGAALSANVTIAGQVVVVSQAGATATTCSYSVSPLAPPAIAAGGGVLNVTIQTNAGCPWTITGVPSWVTLVGSASGSGPVSVNFLFAQNGGAANHANISVAGSAVSISQSGVGTVPVLNAAGSLAQIASGGGWSTSLTLLNLGTASTEARLDLRGDDGSAMPLPLVFPQQTSGNSQVGSTIDQSINPGAQLIVNSSAAPNTATGWAQLSATGNVSGFAIFEDLLTNYQAVVPLETRNAPAYVLAFDNSGGVTTGLAIANPSPQAATIPVRVRNESGHPIATGTLALAGQGHTSFMLTDTLHGGYAQTAGQRGTVEFDTPSGGQISVLGLRANNGKALTTLPVLAEVGEVGGTIAHIAFGAGWQTLLTLVNTGSTQAQVNLNYFDDAGNKLTVPMLQPASGATKSATTVTEILAPWASLVIQTQGAEDAPQTSTGWVQLTTSGNVSGFAVFQIEKTLQEAVVPLESRQAGTYVLAFDNSGGLTTGLAIANAASLAATIPVVVRDDTGQQLASGTVGVAAHGHTSFMLTDTAHGGYAQTTGKRGTIEFGTPTGGQISVLGIRATAAGIITTIPSLMR